MSGTLVSQISNFEGEGSPRRPQSAEMCSSCQKIANAVVIAKNDPTQRTTLKLGPWRGYLDRRQCACCQKIVQYFEEQRQGTLMFEPSCHLEFAHITEGYWMLKTDYTLDPHSEYSDSEISSAIYHPVLHVIPMEIFGERYPYYVPTNPTKIDITRFTTWSSYCDQHHQGSCHSLLDWQIMPPASSLIFVDVQDYCLVQVSDNMSYKYVTLSYVWGRLPGSIELKKQDLSQMCVSNALKTPSYLSRTPNTIKDAMALTAAMGLRYLWVDRLCVIQDDPAHLTKQLQQMAQIYANSHFTIIEADGTDANYGLRRMNPGDSPRSFVDSPFEFTSSVKMIQISDQESVSNKPFWHTRAWTFQERAVSRRTLVFTKNTVYWQCRSAVWFENIAAEPEGLRTLRYYDSSSTGWPSHSLNVNPWPDMDQYFGLISGYNHRNLSFESDALHAFTAITTAMSKSFPGGFYIGLPTFLFDLGMLWTGDQPLRRRNNFPSWSWLGWVGSVKLSLGYKNSWNPALSGFEVETDIQPLVNWCTKREIEGLQFSIDNSYSRYKVDLQDPDLNLPEGWTKARNAENKVEGVRHKRLPNALFSFPFPIFPAPTKDIMEHSSYLEFEAESCTLLLGSSNASGFESNSLLMVDLRDSKGHWAGVIESQFVHQDEYALNIPCELIAISEGRARQNEEICLDGKPLWPFHEMGRVQEIEKLKEYTFYNVLWIEWVGSVAYRKTIGRVWKEAWKRQNINVVNVVLG